MQRQVVGAALTVVGSLILLLAPVHVVQGCVYSVDAGVCGVEQGSSSMWGWVDYPAGWYWAILPMAFIGIALVVTGIVLLIKRRRSRGSASTAG
jgi:hypothetical protein